MNPTDRPRASLEAGSPGIGVPDREPLRLGDVVRVLGTGPGPAAAHPARVGVVVGISPKAERVDVRFEGADVERTSSVDVPGALERISAQLTNLAHNKSWIRNSAGQWEELLS
jgi:hypothetical protein